MSIRFINYPTRITRDKYDLSDLSWSEISSVSHNGDAPFVLKLGDTKDGMTLVATKPDSCVFSMGDVGYGVLPSEYLSRVDFISPPEYTDITTTGWYLGTEYAEHGAGVTGVTRQGILDGLSSDIRSVIKTVSKSCRRCYSGASDYRDDYTEMVDLSLDVYPPNYDEWQSYRPYLPNSNTYWLRDAATYSVWGDMYITVGYRCIAYPNYEEHRNFQYHDSYDYNDDKRTRYGTKYEKLVLLFEV